jgi:hypothetical protein
MARKPILLWQFRLNPCTRSVLAQVPPAKLPTTILYLHTGGDTLLTVWILYTTGLRSPNNAAQSLRHCALCLRRWPVARCLRLLLHLCRQLQTARTVRVRRGSQGGMNTVLPVMILTLSLVEVCFMRILSLMFSVSPTAFQPPLRLPAFIVHAALRSPLRLQGMGAVSGNMQVGMPLVMMNTDMFHRMTLSLLPPRRIPEG